MLNIFKPFYRIDNSRNLDKIGAGLGLSIAMDIVTSHGGEIKAHNSPEGIHKDGANYIISAFVINKKNIIGGKSIIYNENKNKIYETIINNNEFIFQEDKNLWHYVTPIETYDSNYNGIRDIIGLDIKIN